MDTDVIDAEVKEQSADTTDESSELEEQSQPAEQPETPPADPPKTDATRAREAAIADVQARLCQQLEDLRAAEDEWKEAHDAASGLKKLVEKKQDRLNDLVSELRDVIAGRFSPTLPFPPDDASPMVDEAWKAVPLAELGLTGKLAESLTEAGLTTLGAIADYTASGKLLTDIAGIGPAKAEEIEKACEVYWERHPRTEPVTEDPLTAMPDDGPPLPDTDEEEIDLPFAKSLKIVGILSLKRIDGKWWSRAWFTPKGQETVYCAEVVASSGREAGRAEALRRSIRNVVSGLRTRGKEAAAEDLEAWWLANIATLVFSDGDEQAACTQGAIEFDSGGELAENPHDDEEARLAYCWRIGWLEARQHALDTSLPNDVDTEEALDHCEEILRLVDAIPTAGQAFADSVAEKAEAIKAWVIEHEDVTEDQLTALRNMREGVERWVR